MKTAIAILLLAVTCHGFPRDARYIVPHFDFESFGVNGNDRYNQYNDGYNRYAQPAQQLKSALSFNSFYQAATSSNDLNNIIQTFRNTNDDFEGAIEFFQDPVNACQFLINNVDCRETCNFCDLCKTPGADQLICESTSQLCNNQFWQNPHQCTNICENGQSQCKKFIINSNSNYPVVNNLY